MTILTSVILGEGEVAQSGEIAPSSTRVDIKSDNVHVGVNEIAPSSAGVNVKSDKVYLGGHGTSYRIVWDEIGSRFYENGLDRGVIYLENGLVVPWNGLTSVVEKNEKEVSSVYFDGMLINTLVSLGDFSATMKAITYPDELIELEGVSEFMKGVYLGNQRSQQFNLSYRTLVGNDLQEGSVGYKIHILYNVVIVPTDRTFETISGGMVPSEFEWNIVAVPEDIDGYNPTAHIIINSVDFNEWLLQQVESILYGSESSPPSLPSMSEMISYLKELSQLVGTVLIYIVDNNDGTWTATTDQDGLIVVDENGFFEILDANSTFAGDSYTISDTIIN